MTSGHYFDRVPEAPSRPATVELVLPDRTLTLRTDRGVFAGDRVDAGTKYLLLDGPPLPDHGPFLDLGCGYGPIACTLAARVPTATVWAVDVNERARSLCATNAAVLGLPNVRVAAPEEVPAEVSFTAVWSNPPIRIGKGALHDLLRVWLGRLAPGGTAALVVSKHLGSDSLAAWLAAEGWPTERLGSRQGYRILRVTAAPPSPPGDADAAAPRSPSDGAGASAPPSPPGDARASAPPSPSDGAGAAAPRSPSDGAGASALPGPPDGAGASALPGPPDGAGASAPPSPSDGARASAPPSPSDGARASAPPSPSDGARAAALPGPPGDARVRPA